MKRVFLTALCLTLAASISSAQGSTAISEDYQLTPVWEFLNTKENPHYPWLKAQQGTNWQHDGSNTMDFFSTLIRYDDSRLILFLLENGIDEANATPEELAIAEQFPDRSVLWINPVDGSPMGVALDLPLYPAPDSEFYQQKVTGTHPDGPTSDRSWALLEQWPQIAVDGDGYLYVSDKHKVLRYTPNDANGFDGPEIVFTYPELDPPTWMGDSTNQHYRAWTIRSMNVKGSGANKVMTTAARFWIDGGGMIYYTSNDGGASFEIQHHRSQGGYVGTGGTASMPVIVDELGEEWVFGTGFPGSSNRLFRFVRFAGSTEQFEIDPAELWNPQPDPADVSEVEKYNMWEMIDVAAADGVPYVAVLTLPKWQSRNNADYIDATAWVALHSTELNVNDDFVEGAFVASYQIDSREDDEFQGLDAEDNWDAAYLATINMHVLNDGTVEILWSGGNNGFGRLVVGDVDVAVQDWSLF